MKLKTKSIQNSEQPTLITVTNKEPNRPNPEVLKKKLRRRITAKYKLNILAEVEICAKLGDIGVLLRRDGLYYSNIQTWQRQKQKGALKGLTTKKRGRKKHEVNALAKRVAELKRDNTKLAKKLKQAETIIEVQKNIGNYGNLSARKQRGKSDEYHC